MRSCERIINQLLAFVCLEPLSVVLLFQRFKPTPVPSGKVVYSGWLNKRGGTGMTPRNWRRRWFVVRDDCIAYYYSSPEVSLCSLFVCTIYTGNSCIQCVVFSTCSSLVIIGILPMLSGHNWTIGSCCITRLHYIQG